MHYQQLWSGIGTFGCVGMPHALLENKISEQLLSMKFSKMSWYNACSDVEPSLNK